MKLTTCYLLLMFCPTALAQAIPPLEISYDQAKNLTSVSSGDSSADDAATPTTASHLYFTVKYTCPGKTTHCIPHDVEFAATDNAGSGYDKAHDLTFVANGKNLPTITTEYSYDTDADGVLMNQMDAHIPIASFREIALAGAVEGKLGMTTFKLNARTLAKLRSLIDEMQPPTKEKKSS